MAHDHEHPDYMQHVPGLVRLMQFTFRELCDQHKIPLEIRREMCIHAFLGMLHEDYAYDEWYVDERATNLIAAAEVDEDTWQRLMELEENPDLYRTIVKLWDYVAWFDQPLPTYPVASVQMATVLRWHDNKLMIIPATAVTADGKIVMCEADVRSFMCSVGEQMSANLTVTMDQLHDGPAVMVSPHTVQLFYQAMVTGISNMKLDAALEMQSLIQTIMKIIPLPGKEPENQATARLVPVTVSRPTPPTNPDLGGGWSS